jgi:serine/threonine-protein kinase
VSALKTCPQCGSEYELDIKFCPKDGTTLRAPAGGNLVGSVIADRYHVLRKLGEGGMGQVYLAEHVKMGRKSAIKVMNPSMSHDPDAIGRFNREAANASRISHNNVAAIYDFGETPDGLIYLAMEFIEGEALTKIMEREGALSPARAADITRQVADALDAAHEMGIVHRDLKPDNIMIAKHRDGSDAVKVVDFGIAKSQQGEGQKVTKTGLVVGTPEYMSPEQLAGDALDGRSDTYTLGLVTFHMLTGTLPFPSSTIQESMIMRLTDRPRTLAEMRPDVSWPAPLQQALDRALVREVSARYQRASDFASDLVRAVSGMTAGAAPADGTQLVNTPLAPTRVRASGDGASSAPGAPATAATTAPSPAAPPTRRKRLIVPLGAGATLAAAAVAIWLTSTRQAATKTGAAADTTAGHVLAMRDTTSAGPAAAPAPSHDSTARDSTPGASSAGGEASPAPVRTATGATNDAGHGSASPMANPAASSAAPARHAPPPKPQDTPQRVQQYAKPEQSSKAVPDTRPAETGATAPPPTAPPATPAESNEGGEFEGTLTAERARAAVGIAGNLLLRQPPQTDRALRILGRALKYLPTLNDSVTALYHVSEGLLQRADQTGNAASKQRACTILDKLRAARQHTYASAIAALYGQECQ